ncbi:L-glutamate-binding protein /L-aspartate-binding protein [Crenobacter luteus]|uniref:ABC transporter n=1 Tax=Crenobacter luteus TaxID=1452487 RepID=A0A163BTF4_9NEIS|nr:glutamate/aspartate ABC transporter substrate-binding protein [Crenobacter luteus]KZE28893.1 ABC transporter [Crenobacter luteus]TCP11404.1 L-glutamate-binding protein /L-aspartate-binding protein [Crenobacter luteus]
MRFHQKLIASAVVGGLLVTPAFAEGTLDKIKKTGTITLGHRDSSIPFSYLANSPQPIGYSVDIANKVVDKLKKDLNMPNLQVKYNLVTSQTRIPLVQNGTVDLECGSTTNNLERQRQVDFSVGIFEIGTRLLTKKTSGVKDFPDLKGKNVVTTAGTTSERLLKSMNAEQGLGMNVISAKDHGESFLMLETGRAVAFMMDDVLLAGEMAKAKRPADWVVTGKPQSFEIYGCMMRKGDPAFKKTVDDAIRALYKSGEINKIYAKWFQSPVPPKNVNLNFPMSPEFKKLIQNPTDKSAEQM